MSNILIIGGGFAGVWCAASAAKLREESGTSDSELRVTLVSPGDDLVIRPRLYETAPHMMRVPLDGVLGPIGVRRVAATVVDIDTDAHSVAVVERSGHRSTLSYDRLVLASGSQVVRPRLPGSEHLFDVDTLPGAATLDAHLKRLPERPTSDGQYTAVVVGAGFTGIEVATELTARLRAVAGPNAPVRVVLVERAGDVGPELGPGPRPIILDALSELGVEVRLGVSLVAASPEGVTLSDGATVSANTAIWTAGLIASPLTSLIKGRHDDIGRLVVDPYLRVEGVPDVFAAGDTAAAIATEEHVTSRAASTPCPRGSSSATTSPPICWARRWCPSNRCRTSPASISGLPARSSRPVGSVRC